MAEPDCIVPSAARSVLNELAVLQASRRDARIRPMLLAARRGMAPWPPVLLVCGPGFATAAHRHHCVQLLMALQGSLRVRRGRAGRWRRCGAVWVRPDAVHQMDGRGSSLLIGFISAESDMGAGISARIEGEIAVVPAKQVARWREVLGASPDVARAERWLSRTLMPRRRDVRIHPGVRRVLTYLHEPRAVFDGLSLNALAEIAGLSPSRFMHVFTESVGIPVRPYILWIRLQRGACDLMDGASVTNAAHRAGFSDAAHMTRTFRRLLGATPSDLALLKRLSMGFSLVSDENRTRAARAIDGAA